MNIPGRVENGVVVLRMRQFALSRGRLVFAGAALLGADAGSAEELALSRLYGGIPWSFDNNVGLDAGT
jgi:hypothetical protein